MDSISKRPTTNDRISNLSNNLIGHILSFLPTKDAVKTSSLSRNWNQHWTLVTRLDFDDGYWRNDGGPFVKFVYRVLLFKVTCLDSFRLRCKKNYDAAHVGTWLSVALSRNVREIELSIHMDGSPLLPDCLFSCTTLAVLKLGKGILVKVPTIISLESLKILHLLEVYFEDSESISRLVSSCPLLEELRFEGKLSKGVNLISISSRLLKKLIFNRLYDLRWSEINGTYSYKVVLDTPSLEYFEHVDKGVPGYQIETLNSLETAWLCLRLSNDQLEEYDDELVLARSMVDLAVAISNIRFLYLSEHALKAFFHPVRTMPNYELPKFPNLTDLKIVVIQAHAGLLTDFLQCLPKLAYLAFGIEESSEESSSLPVSWDPPPEAPFCMLYNLRVIEVGCLCEVELGVRMVKYFLEKTISLKQLIIPQMREKNAEVIKEVLLFPVASKSCKIVLT